MMVICDVKFDTKYDQILWNSGQEPSMSSKYDCVCNASELIIGIQLNNDILRLFVMSNLIPKMTQSSKTPVRNHQCPPSMTVFLIHFNHAKDLKSNVQLNNEI